jgi:hypothetical protein
MATARASARAGSEGHDRWYRLALRVVEVIRPQAVTGNCTLDGIEVGEDGVGKAACVHCFPRPTRRLKAGPGRADNEAEQTIRRGTSVSLNNTFASRLDPAPAVMPGLSLPGSTFAMALRRTTTQPPDVGAGGLLRRSSRSTAAGTPR